MPLFGVIHIIWYFFYSGGSVNSAIRLPGDGLTLYRLWVYASSAVNIANNFKQLAIKLFVCSQPLLESPTKLHTNK